MPRPAGIHRTADGHPDFTGFYEWPKSDGEQCRCSATVFDRKNFAPLKPGGEPFLEPRTGDPRHDEPRDFCMPAGFPSGMLSAYAMQFFQNKDNLIMVHEFQRMTRVIPLDGRKHREDMEPTFYGDPVGHWEGDTLVIETTGFKRWGLDDYFYKDEKEYRMHSAMALINHRAHQVSGPEDAFLQPHHRRSQNVRGTVVAGVQDQSTPGVGEERDGRVRVRGEQSLPRRTLRRRRKVIARGEQHQFVHEKLLRKYARAIHLAREALPEWR